MSKRNYTHVEELFSEIEAMIQAGKTQREIAEYFGFKDKHVVKELLRRNSQLGLDTGVYKILVKAA